MPEANVASNEFNGFRKLTGPTAGPDFRPDALESMVAQKPKNQLAKLYQFKRIAAELSTSDSTWQYLNSRIMPLRRLAAL